MKFGVTILIFYRYCFIQYLFSLSVEKSLCSFQFLSLGLFSLSAYIYFCMSFSLGKLANIGLIVGILNSLLNLYTLMFFLLENIFLLYLILFHLLCSLLCSLVICMLNLWYVLFVLFLCSLKLVSHIHFIIWSIASVLYITVSIKGFDFAVAFLVFLNLFLILFSLHFFLFFS